MSLVARLLPFISFLISLALLSLPNIAQAQNANPFKKIFLNTSTISVLSTQNTWIPVSSTAQTVEIDANGESATLSVSGISLSPGTYKAIRLMIPEGDGVGVKADGSTLPVKIPSSQNQGLKLNGQFTIGNCFTSTIGLNFDLTNILTYANKKWILDASTTATLSPTSALPPTISIMSPKGKFTNQTSQLVEVEFSSQCIDVSSLSVKINGVEQKQVFTVNGTSAKATLSFQQGSNTIEASISDLSANRSNAAPFNFTVDLVVPQVTLSQIPNYLNSSILSVQVSGTDSLSGIDTNSLIATLNGVDVSSSFSFQGSSFNGSLSLTAQGTQSLLITLSDLAGNSQSVTKQFIFDSVPPILSEVSPATDSLIYSQTLTLGVGGKSNEALSSASVLVDGVSSALTLSDDKLSFFGVISFQQGGLKTLTFSARDLAGNVITSASSINFVFDNSPPAISISQLSPSLTNNPNFSMAIQVSDQTPSVTKVFKNGTLSFQTTNTNFTYSTVLSEGANSFIVSSIDSAGNVSSSYQFSNIVLDTTPPLIQIAQPTDGSTQSTKTISVSGTSDSPLSFISVNGVSLTLSTDKKLFSGELTAAAFGPYALSFTAADVVGNIAQKSVSVTIEQSNLPELPPDPKAVAPSLAENIIPSYSSNVSFLYSGSNPVQSGVAAGTMLDNRVSVLKGKVLRNDGSGLGNVKVTAVGHSEYGYTVTRADGNFDFALNGGLEMKFNFERPGYLPVQRGKQINWNEYSNLEDVFLTELDSKVTNLSFSSATQTMQVASGNIVTDERGTRNAALMIPPGTTAQLVLQDGSTQNVSTLGIRATEYTVGANGPKKMPAPLPAQTGYTYAVELSADEALAVNAKEIKFSQPAFVYINDFIGFPVGSAVPAGYYDKVKAQWISSDNGRVIKVLSVGSGYATLDVEGSNSAASPSQLSALRFTDLELAQIASNYPSGSVLWRVPVTHLTPWDLNWPFMLPPDSYEPILIADSSSSIDEKFAPICGSVIDPVRQTLGENINIAGTGLDLTYITSRSPGMSDRNRIKVPLLDSSIPQGLHSIKVYFDVAGQSVVRSFTPSANLITEFIWDGKDSYGRAVNGQTIAQVRTEYLYDGFYIPVYSTLVNAFGRLPTNAVLTRIPSNSPMITLTRSTQVKLGIYDASAMSLGGWTLSNHHYYDRQNEVLHLGTGEDVAAKVDSFTAFAGAGPVNLANGHYGDGGSALNAQFVYPRSISEDPQGNLFITERAGALGCSIRRVKTNGIIESYIGANSLFGGSCGIYYSSSDGGSVSGAQLGDAIGKVVARSDGSIVFSNWSSIGSFIFRVDKNGILTRLAGWADTSLGYSQGHQPPTVATYATDISFQDGIYSFAFDSNGGFYLSTPGQIWYVDTNGKIFRTAGQPLQANGLAMGADGRLYFTDENSVKRLNLDGTVSLVAGSGSAGWSGDGGLATLATLNSPFEIVINADNSMYISDSENKVIRFIDQNGIISTITKHPTTNAFSGLNGPLSQAQVTKPYAIAKALDGGLFIESELAGTMARISKVSRSMLSASIGSDKLTLPSPDGNEVYVFDSAGTHLETRFSNTNAIKYKFIYANQKLVEVDDAFGRPTVFARTGAGDLSAIISPDGVTTQIGLNNGLISEVKTPDNKSHLFSYYPSGLLATYQKPNLGVSSFQYDLYGRLTKDTNAENGFSALSNSGTDFINFNVAVQTAENRTSIYSSDQTVQGSVIQTLTSSSGAARNIRTDLDATTTITSNDGTVQTSIIGADPRFQMMSPIVTSDNVVTPSGNSRTVASTRAVVLNNTADYLSVTSITDTTSVNSKSTSTVFNALANTIASTSPLGKVVSSTINNVNQLTGTSVSGINPVSLAYFPNGKLQQVAQGARATGFAYDSNGYLQSVTDSMNQTTTYSNDVMGRVLSKTLPDSRVVNFSYDANGNLTSVTPPSKPTHSFVLDLLGKIKLYNPPSVAASNNTSYQYNLEGNLTQITRPDGQVATLTYNSTKGTLDQISTSQGNYTNSFNTTTGQLASSISPDGIHTDYSYDGFLPQQTTWSNGISGSFSTYQNNNFNVYYTYINNSLGTQYFYNDDQELIQAGSIVINRNSANGQINSTTLASSTESYTYNAYGEVATYSGPSYSLDLTSRDNLGRITNKVETVQGATTSLGYQYDSSGRLWKVFVNGSLDTTYSYDSNSNRQSVVKNGVTTSSTYDDQDRLLSFGNLSYAYNNNGERISRNDSSSSQTTTYSYDVFGNLKSVGLPSSTTISYLLDANQRRVGKKINGSLVKGFLYGSQLKVVAELNSSNAVVSQFIYGTKANVPDYMVKGGINYKFVTDQIGSARLVVNAANGSVVQRIDYDEFGKVLNDTNPGFQPFGFAGGMYDPDTGLTHFGAREYDAETGRWLSKDPTRFNGGDTNLYGYVLNDPINFNDPLGLWAIAVGPTVSGILGGGFEAGGGFYFGTTSKGGFDIGFYASGGTGFGVNIGASVGASYYNSTDSISGNTTNFNLGAGAISGTLQTPGGSCSSASPNSSIAGTAGAGYGWRYGASVTDLNTGTFGISDIVRIINRGR